jgi:radical SAM protein with 4Fe4S-binding SPASM domain
VITADFGGMKEYVQHKVNGLLYEHRNVDSLAEQMRYAITSPDLMKQYGERGYLYSEDGKVPSIKDHCSELVKIYNRYTALKNLWRITIDTNPEDCNLKCMMCEEHSIHSDFILKQNEGTGVKHRRMSIEKVEEIFKQAQDLGVKEIIPSTMGEPLIYKDIERIFDLSVKHGIKINLTTNGTFPKIDIEEWAKLIVPNTSDIKISWNGSTKETAEYIMHGLNFDQVLENIKAFISARDNYYQQTGYYCRITFQSTFMQTNVHELSDIIKLAAQLGVDRVKGHHVWTHFNEIKPLSMKASAESITQWNNCVEKAHQTQEIFRKPNGDKVILENFIPLQNNEHYEVPEHYECPFLTKELWVSATGNISPCCAPDNLRKSLGEFGNIETSNIEEVLKSSAYTELVNTYKTNSLCKTCNMRKPIC